MPDENKVTESNTRTRINISLTAKGSGQWECTAEYDTPERCKEELTKAIEIARSILKEKNIPEAGSAA